MTDTIKPPHKFKPLFSKLKELDANGANKIKIQIFCEYCGLFVQNKESDYSLASNGCPCAPIQQEEKCTCSRCKGEEGFVITADCGPVWAWCAKCNGTGKT